tara:strand:+ start:279 stop:446 length:168 start_codon:yes stop_codon:yes gene_type:complete
MERFFKKANGLVVKYIRTKHKLDSLKERFEEVDKYGKAIKKAVKKAKKKKDKGDK